VLDCDSKGAGQFFAMLVLRNLVYGETCGKGLQLSILVQQAKEKLTLKEA